jgi:hypothetical protein
VLPVASPLLPPSIYTAGLLIGSDADPLGWQRTPRDVTPTLSELLREDHALHMHKVDHGG